MYKSASLEKIRIHKNLTRREQLLEERTKFYICVHLKVPVVLGCSLSFPAWTSTKRSTWECKILMCLPRRWASLLINFKNMHVFTGILFLHALTALKKPICSFIEGNLFLTLLLTFVTLLFHYLRRFWRFSQSLPWQPSYHNQWKKMYNKEKKIQRKKMQLEIEEVELNPTE